MNFDHFPLLSLWGVVLGIASPGWAQATLGTVDPGFAPGSGVDQSVFAMAVQTDLKIIIAGDFTSFDGTPRRGVARLHGSGALDAGFDARGGANDVINSVVLQNNGKIVVAGYFTQMDGVDHGHVARLEVDGRVDTGFSVETDEPVLVVAQDLAGRLVLGGSFTKVNGIGRNGIARLGADGTLDRSFDPGSGVKDLDFATVNALALSADGGVIIGGRFLTVNGNPRTHLARLGSEGQLDLGYLPKVDLTGAGLLSGIYALGLLPGGQLMAAGDFTGINGIARSNIARLNTDGTLDANFDPQKGIDRQVSSLLIQPDGKVLVGGYFGFANGLVRNNFARLLDNGLPDKGFSSGVGPDDAIYCLALQPDGKVLLGGTFRSVDGIPSAGVARVLGERIDPRPTLIFSARDAAGFHLSFQSVAGRSYRLQFKEALANGEWQPSGLPPWVGDGGVHFWTDATVAAGSRYYRLIVD